MTTLQEIETELNNHLGEKLFSLEGVESDAPSEWPRIGGFISVKVRSTDKEALSFVPYLLAKLVVASRKSCGNIYTATNSIGRTFVFERGGQWWGFDYETPGLLKNKDNGTYRITGAAGPGELIDGVLIIKGSFGEYRYLPLNETDLEAKVPTVEARRKSSVEFDEFFEKLHKRNV
jgi:hypothetical protein